MKLYNTLTRKKEEFTPLSDKVVTMYSCGPTVYNYAHIGNLRTYVFMDLLRRGLRYNGFKLRGAMNITDVGHLLSDGDEGEDKMVKAAKEQQKTPWEIAAYYTDVFFADCKKLNIGIPEIIAKATDYIPEMIDYVVKLDEKGYAYETDDGIYFDIARFPSYGKLSGINLEEQKAGGGERVEKNTQKRHHADFAIWKKAEPNHIMQWESPWGQGYPGWHIECSAMSRKFFGKLFDIHTGGVDHIPIHHENEIAQSEALEGQKTVNFWMHGEFMLVDGGKMSKSLGNTYTIDELSKRGFSPLAFRYFCLNAHYRSKLNFTFEGLKAAQTSLERLYGLLWKHKSVTKNEKRETKNDGCNSEEQPVGADPLGSPHRIDNACYTGAPDGSPPTMTNVIQSSNCNPQSTIHNPQLNEYQKNFADAIADDLNVPLALGVLWTMLKEPPSPEIYALACEFDKAFGLDFDKVQAPEEKAEDDIPEEVTKLAAERWEARKNKQWVESDRLRNLIAEKGYAVEDGKEGYKLKRS
ncbi:MAG: cysteine--tRNA ligase [Firmicutes bacterium]|nr:cysteine--tRNA ligase [Bacillota bacterium]